MLKPLQLHGKRGVSGNFAWFLGVCNVQGLLATAVPWHGPVATMGFDSNITWPLPCACKGGRRTPWGNYLLCLRFVVVMLHRIVQGNWCLAFCCCSCARTLDVIRNGV